MGHVCILCLIFILVIIKIQIDRPKTEDSFYVDDKSDKLDDQL
jgi:hypothetical protein